MKLKFTLTGEMEVDECACEELKHTTPSQIQKAIEDDIKESVMYNAYGEITESTLNITTTLTI